jgi:hypothetical protein
MEYDDDTDTEIRPVKHNKRSVISERLRADICYDGDTCLCRYNSIHHWGPCRSKCVQSWAWTKWPEVWQNKSKLEKDIPNLFCVRCEVKWKITEICGCLCQCSSELFDFPEHPQRNSIQILRTSTWHLLKKEGCHKYLPTFINKLSDHDMEMFLADMCSFIVYLPNVVIMLMMNVSQHKT